MGRVLEPRRVLRLGPAPVRAVEGLHRGHQIFITRRGLGSYNRLPQRVHEGLHVHVFIHLKHLDAVERSHLILVQLVASEDY